ATFGTREHERSQAALHVLIVGGPLAGTPKRVLTARRRTLLGPDNPCPKQTPACRANAVDREGPGWSALSGPDRSAIDLITLDTLRKLCRRREVRRYPSSARTGT